MQGSDGNARRTVRTNAHAVADGVGKVSSSLDTFVRSRDPGLERENIFAGICVARTATRAIGSPLIQTGARAVSGRS